MKNRIFKDEPHINTKRAKFVISGGILALAVISFFVLSADAPHPGWSSYWMVKPLLLTPFAGAFGGLVVYYCTRLAAFLQLNKVVAFLLSVPVYIVILWLGIILGLNGTLWN
jgi:pilus assembly protein TadC